MPECRSRLEFDIVFSAEEYEKIAFGLIPLDMDDKWVIFLEDDWLYFHRSWTGACIYQIKLKAEGDKYCVTEAWVNRNSEQYGATDNEYDAKLLSFLIDNFLLGRTTPFPLPCNLPNDLPKGAYQHSISGSGYRETK